jgi:lysophospholipase L1-like esterase
MNINEAAVKILCYGDSNTWGYIPVTKNRYPVGVRWTSLVQQYLGKDYWLIEEGLNSRTTDLDDINKPGRNGLEYLIPCLETHNPLDMVVLFLGTNDLKKRYQRTPEEISQSIQKLVQVIKKRAANKQGRAAEILLLSPPLVDESVPGVKEKYLEAEEKSEQLGRLYKKVATEEETAFIDLSRHVSPSKKDGYHFEPEAHEKVAALVYRRIKRLIIKKQIQPLLEKCRPGDFHHSQRVVSWVEKLAAERTDWERLILAAFCHDLGWYGITKKEKMTKAELKKLEPKANNNSEKQIRQFLQEIGIEKTEVKEILRLVAAADSHCSEQDDEAVIVDADNLSKLTIKHLKEKYQPSDWMQWVKLWEKEFPQRIQTDQGKKIYPKLLKKLRQAVEQHTG